MTEFLQTLHQQFARFQTRFGAHLLGVANIASYCKRGLYVRDANELAQYYHTCWPRFRAMFDTVRAYKTDEARRQVVFDEVARGSTERIRTIQDCAKATVELWAQFCAQDR